MAKLSVVPYPSIRDAVTQQWDLPNDLNVIVPEKSLQNIMIPSTCVLIDQACYRKGPYIVKIRGSRAEIKVSRKLVIGPHISIYPITNSHANTMPNQHNSTRYAFPCKRGISFWYGIQHITMGKILCFENTTK